MSKDEKKKRKLELVRAKPAKQKELEGFERKRIKAVDDAAEEYVEVRDERMALTEKEVAAKAKLIRVCVENKVTKYLDTSVSPPLEVEISPSELDVKVKRRKVAEEE